MATSTILDSSGNPYNYGNQPYKMAHAADPSNRRGPQFAVRNEDIERLIPSNDRRTLASLSTRMYINMGVPQGCIRQKADYAVGEAWLPQYTGQDRDAGNKAAKFLHDVWYPQATTIGGIFDWWKLLELSSIEMDKCGDVFWMFVVGSDNFPRIQMISGNRCRSDYQSTVQDGDYKGYRIVDGVIYYSSGRPAAYQFDLGKDGKTKYVTIPASDVIHIYDPIHAEQGRGFPAFTHALEGLKMSLLSTEDERIRQQIVSRLHLTIFNDTGEPDGDNPLTRSDVSPCMTGDEIMRSQSFPGGTVYMPGDGQHRIEQMKHENPGVVWSDFQDRIIRDAVLPVWSYNIWKGGGQGTEARGEVVKCRRFVSKRQSDLWQAARRAFSWAYSVFAANGRVPAVSAPWSWDFSRPPRLSVDDGRESSMELNEVRTGTRNISEVLESRGLREDEFIEKRAESVFMRKYIARKKADELNAKFGTDISIEDREMFMQTPNEAAEVDPTESNDDMNEPNESDNEKLRFENLKAKFDAYGVAVRAGAITPAKEDEDLFRTEAGLPTMPKAVAGAWKEDKGFRRPITLLQKGAPASPFLQSTPEE
jgi:Phage portal protein, lambda family